MLPGLEMMAACTDLAVPSHVMRHVAAVESSHNPYAIGVVGGRLVRQPRNLPEALSTARMLEDKGMNFSLGIAQVNRYNLSRYGLGSYEHAFDVCRNVRAGASILAECYGRSGNDWGKAFSCYYSGNFTTGFRHGYVQKVYASMAKDVSHDASAAIPLATGVQRATGVASRHTVADTHLVAHRTQSGLVAARSAQDGSAMSRSEPLPAAYSAQVPAMAGATTAVPAVQRPASGSLARPVRVSLNGVVQQAEPAATPATNHIALPHGAAAPARDSALVF